MYILFDWCAQDGVIKVFKMIKVILQVIRIIIPIILVVMTILDVTKQVINPNEKDGKTKIVNRLIAAIIIFLIPTVINLVMNVVDIGLGSGEGYDYNISDCWNRVG